MNKIAIALGGICMLAGAPFSRAAMPELKISGFLQYRFEYTENPRAIAEDSYAAGPAGFGNAFIDSKSEERLNLALFLDSQINPTTRIHAWVGGEHLSGRTTRTYMDIKEAYIAEKAGPGEVQVGRFLSDVGMGSASGAPYMDGLHLTVSRDWFSAQAYLTKFGNAYSTSEYSPSNDKSSSGYSSTAGVNAHMTFASGDIRVRPIKGLTLCASHFADLTSDGTDNNYKTYAVGASYVYAPQGAPLASITGEYAKNDSDGAKNLNKDLVTGVSSAPIAYFGTLKLLGANPFMPKTWGASIQYRRAESGFDIMGMASPGAWNGPINWSSPSGGAAAENHKGVELGLEFTPWERTLIKAAYGSMKSDSTTTIAAVYAHPVGGVAGKVSTDKENYATASVLVLF